MGNNIIKLLESVSLDAKKTRQIIEENNLKGITHLLVYSFVFELCGGDEHKMQVLLNSVIELFIDRPKIHNNWQTGLPKQSGDYVALTKHGDMMTVHFSKKYQLFNARDEEDEYFTKIYAFDEDVVVKWMSLEEFKKYMLGDKDDSQRSWFWRKNRMHILLINS